MDPNVPGVYFDVSQFTAEREIIVKIPLRILLTQFMIFSNMKWLPSWMGKIILKITPSYRNLVIAPVIPDARFEIYPALVTAMNTQKKNNADPNDDASRLIDFGFFHLNEPTSTRYLFANNVFTFPDAQTWVCNFQKVDQC
jgi:hypothetical protein